MNNTITVTLPIDTFNVTLMAVQQLSTAARNAAILLEHEAAKASMSPLPAIDPPAPVDSEGGTPD